MEQVAAFWAKFQDWIRTLPPPGDPELMVVIATVVGGLGIAALTNGWVERRLSKSGTFAMLVGVMMLVWVWSGQEQFGFVIIPESFIEVLARIIR